MHVFFFFIDFSSALQPYLLLDKLKQMESFYYNGILYFSLTDITEQVKVNKGVSESKLISTEAPQGFVSSLVLFTLYTNGCVCKPTHN